jgi:hypothetical protein
MSKKVRVKRINLDINGKEIMLSLKEAQELKDVLNDMFGVDEVVIYRDRYNTPYWQPYYYGTSGGGQILCSNESTTTSTWSGEVTSDTLNLAIAA